jgi:hypothetical protein
MNFDVELSTVHTVYSRELILRNVNPGQAACDLKQNIYFLRCFAYRKRKQN